MTRAGALPGQLSLKAGEPHTQTLVKIPSFFHRVDVRRAVESTGGGVQEMQVEFTLET